MTPLYILLRIISAPYFVTFYVAIIINCILVIPFGFREYKKGNIDLYEMGQWAVKTTPLKHLIKAIGFPWIVQISPTFLILIYITVQKYI